MLSLKESSFTNSKSSLLSPRDDRTVFMIFYVDYFFACIFYSASRSFLVSIAVLILIRGMSTFLRVDAMLIEPSPNGGNLCV